MSDTALNAIRLAPTPVRTIAAKDIRDGLRDRFILIVTGFLGLAAVVALVTGAIAVCSNVAAYEAAKVSLQKPDIKGLRP